MFSVERYYSKNKTKYTERQFEISIFKKIVFKFSIITVKNPPKTMVV